MAEIANEIAAADRIVAANFKKTEVKNLLNRVGGNNGEHWKVLI